MSFYIEKIIVSGPGKTESIIELSDGLNIIYGPSNTGKTYIVKCIDYMFGSDKEPIDTSAGYKNIVIVVKTPYGTITMNRKQVILKLVQQVQIKILYRESILQIQVEKIMIKL